MNYKEIVIWLFNSWETRI